jgi:hypothetical protein
LGGIGLGAVRLQVLVEFPDLAPHPGDGGAVLVVVRHQLDQRALGVDPAAGMDEDVELRRPVAEHHKVRRHAPGDQAAQQRPLRGDADVPRVRDAQRGQPRLPRGRRGERRRPLGQALHQGRSELLALPVGPGDLVDRVGALAAVHGLQEVQPALAVAALEGREQVVAQGGAIAVVAEVPRPGVVRTDVRRFRQGGGQQLVLFPVKAVFVRGEEAVQLAGRDVDAVLPQLRQQQRLRDLRLVVLVEDVGDQVGPEVATLDRQDARGERRQHRAAAGQVVAGPQVARVGAVDDEFLGKGLSNPLGLAVSPRIARPACRA